MSKEPTTPPEGGEPASHAPGPNAAPSQQPPATRRSRQRQGVHGAPLHDGAGTSSAMAAHGAGHERRVTLQMPTHEGGQVLQYPGQRQERAYREEERLLGHGGAGDMRPPTAAGKHRPYYVRPSRQKQEQPPYPGPPSRPVVEQPPVHGRYPTAGAPPPRAGAPPSSRPAVEQPPLRGRYPHEGVHEEWPATALPRAGAQPSRPQVVEPPPVHGPHSHGGVQEERLATPLPRAGAPPGVGGISIPGADAPPPGQKVIKKKKTKIAFWPGAHGARPQTPGEAVPPGGGVPAATPGGTVPPYGGPGAKTIERVSTLVDTRGESGSPPPPPPHGHDVRPHPHPQQEMEHDVRPHPHAYPYPHHPRQEMEQYPRMTPTGPSRGKKGRTTGAGRPSPLLIPDSRKKKQPAAICFTLCCILFWLLVVGIGVAILVVYLLYHPQPPRLRVTTATLNAGYIDQLPPPRGGLTLNSDLYVLATIYNPNTKVDVVLRYMQLDLFFQGVRIGTQAVWPPIHEDPGESQLRSVHLVVSEVRMSQEDAEVWHNTTTKGGLVEMELGAKFHVQLNFGRWLPFRYWVYPSCSLWLDPPPSGALRRARCRK